MSAQPLAIVSDYVYSLDMLIAGYERDFDDSLRYWRSRFLVIPSDHPPMSSQISSSEPLADEEYRLLGADRLAELFGKARWFPATQRADAYPAPRFLPTSLDPPASVLDDALMASLADIISSGPLGKSSSSDRDLEDMSLLGIAKAMRQEGGLPFKQHQWHREAFNDCFTGYEFVSWLVREFRDVPTREQGVEWGLKLQAAGLLDHVKGEHRFMDG